MLVRSLFSVRLSNLPRYAFEATSPEGDTFLLHSEEDWTTLQRVMIAPAFTPLEDFVGLSQFTIEQIHINAPDKEKAVTFYQEWLGNQSILTFSPASGPDLLTESTQTWDLAMIKFIVEQFDVEALRDLFQGRENFIPKSGKFFLTRGRVINQSCSFSSCFHTNLYKSSRVRN